MTNDLAPLAVLLVTLVSWGTCSGVEPLAEETLDRITAQGQNQGSRESSPGPPQSTGRNASHTILTIQPHSQTHLRAGTVNNTAGRNQIANGINVR